jgi:hypothetical protein
LFVAVAVARQEGYFGDTVTCVISTDPSWPTPQISDRQTAAGADLPFSWTIRASAIWQRSIASSRALKPFSAGEYKFVIARKYGFSILVCCDTNG